MMRALEKILPKLDSFLGKVIVIGILCLVFIFAHRAIFDLDIWSHLKTGQYILLNKTIPYQDVFSFTRQGMPWPSHRWLFQVLSYWVYIHWHAEGLILLECYVLMFCFYFLLLIGMQCTRSYLDIALCLLLSVYASMTRFNIRPEIFGLLFFAIYLYILRFHTTKKWIWLLVPVQVLWVNFHFFYFLGPVLVFFFVAAEFFRRKVKILPFNWKEEFVLSDTVYSRLKRLFLLTVLACFVNPKGPEMAVYPFVVFKEIFTGQSAIFRDYIVELQPTFKTIARIGIYYNMLLWFCLWLMIFNIKRLKIVEIFLAGFFYVFGLTVRNVANSSFVAYMIIISYLGPTLNRFSSKMDVRLPHKNILGYLLRFILALYLVGFLILKMSSSSRQVYYDFKEKRYMSSISGIDNRNFPSEAVDFVIKNRIPENMFNDFNSGAYLIGRTYPSRKVFIDGRTEVYGADFFKEYTGLMHGDRTIFEGTVNKYRISSILFTMTIGSMPKITKYIYGHPQWKLVFLDDKSAIFLKDIPANQQLIKRFQIDLNKYTPTAADLISLGTRKVEPTPYLKRAALFYMLEKYDLVILEAEEALRIEPNSYRSYGFIGKAYLRKGLYKEALEHLRAALLLAPRNVDLSVELGSCLWEMKEFPSARKSFIRAIVINPRYAEAYYRLGDMYLELKNENLAAQYLEKAVKLSPKEGKYRLRLVDAFFALAKKTKKKSFLIKAEQELFKASKMEGQDLEFKKEAEKKLKELEKYKISLAIS